MRLIHSESGKPCGVVPCEAYKRLEEENDLAGLYARSLAVSIWRRRYSSESPAWEPLGTPAGVISQIDNMVAGLMNDLSKAEAENARLAADVQKHKERREHFEDMLNRSIEHEQEWTQRALKAEEENAALKQELEALGSACDKIRIQSKYHRRKTYVVQKATTWWRNRARKLQNERDALVQVSAEVCPECGWAMKFPDEPCRNCEVIALRKVREKADALATDVLANCEDCCERCEECVFASAAMKAKAYQEARHG